MQNMFKLGLYWESFLVIVASNSFLIKKRFGINSTFCNPVIEFADCNIQESAYNPPKTHNQMSSRYDCPLDMSRFGAEREKRKVWEIDM